MPTEDADKKKNSADPGQTDLGLHHYMSENMTKIQCNHVLMLSIEPRQEKTCLLDFRPGPTQTRLRSYRS